MHHNNSSHIVGTTATFQAPSPPWIPPISWELDISVLGNSLGLLRYGRGGLLGPLFEISRESLARVTPLVLAVLGCREGCIFIIRCESPMRWMTTLLHNNGVCRWGFGVACDWLSAGNEKGGAPPAVAGALGLIKM